MTNPDSEAETRLAEARAEERRWRDRETDRDGRTDARIAEAIAERHRIDGHR